MMKYSNTALQRSEGEDLTKIHPQENSTEV